MAEALEVARDRRGDARRSQLLWVVVVGVVGIIVYSEMCGRVAAASKRPVFDAVRERMGFGVGAGC